MNDAFQTALSGNDLGLVMFTCELVNTTQIFSQATCPLDQSVLLSLIQQLSVDLQVTRVTNVLTFLGVSVLGAGIYQYNNDDICTPPFYLFSFHFCHGQGELGLREGKG